MSPINYLIDSQVKTPRHGKVKEDDDEEEEEEEEEEEVFE
jgi:hypothetical protein